MQKASILKSAVLMLVLVVTIVMGYEIYLRNKGLTVSYNDDPALWSDKRAMVYGPSEKQVVIIGSSRIKFDLDIPTWKNETGLDAVQLSMVGSSPRPTLEDLASDPEFKGRLIIDVTEPLFFSSAPPYQETPNKNIKYFHERTPAQRAGFEVNTVLESQLVFLDKENLSMNAELDALQIPSRPGIFMMPTFPIEFDRTDFDRQSYMTEHFVADTVQINQVRNVWKFLFSGPKPPPMTDAQITSALMEVKKCTDKIKARGGQVLFVRTPSSGPFLMGETMGFPRARYWDRILAVTGCPGIHFMDNPATAHFQCPEFSHLNRTDARLFTHSFIEMLESKGWVFPAGKGNRNFKS